MKVMKVNFLSNLPSLSFSHVQSRSPRHSQSTQSGLADQASKLSYASAESLETMSEADMPLGFNRMNRFRQSLPLSRSASQNKLRSPGNTHTPYIYPDSLHAYWFLFTLVQSEFKMHFLYAHACIHKHDHTLINQLVGSTLCSTASRIEKLNLFAQNHHIKHKRRCWNLIHEEKSVKSHSQQGWKV